MFSSRVGGPTGRRRTRRQGAWVVFVITALVALSAVSAAGATRPAVSGDFAKGAFTPVSIPLGLQNKPTTLVVQLAGDPVTVADAKSANGFNNSQWNSLRDQLRSQQAPVESQIRSLGGQVLAAYQLAYNGIKVEIRGNQADALAAIPGVVAVRQLQVVTPDNTHGVPLIGAPAVWGGLPGLHGEGIKIADIDTGIDYTHADFGGSGNPLDYKTALASDTLPANPAWFGPTAPRVKGGIDLVGDNYAAGGTAAQQIPHPDPNPLDCNNHGTHTAGTAAGSGVLSNGSTYTGPYDANTISTHSWNVGPGVAPKADIYSVRVFGCTGSTNVVVDAIEWAVTNHMDVINMSLGSSFGSPDSPDAVASTNAARDGVIVIASSGNSGSNAYITGSPAASAGALSVAANDPTQQFPGANLTLTKANLTSGGTRSAIVINGFSPLPTGPMNIRVVWTSPAHTAISNGCSVAQDTAEGPVAANTILVVARGVCARVAKAIFAQQSGAAAAIMVNNASSYPPYEGKITADPDAAGPPLFGGFDYTVTIPYLGVQGGSNPSTSAAGAQLRAADGGTLTMTPSSITNPAYLALASFSSYGPATGDSSMKPNVTAPGVSIASAGMATGTEAIIESGTSMAAPHTTGLAALVKQAHPSWGKVKYWEAAIQNTADPAGVLGFNIRGAGTGLVQALPATQTQVVALGSSGRGGENDDDNHEGGHHGGNSQTGTLNFGFNEIDRDFSQTASVQLRNFSNSPVTFAVTDAVDQGSPHSVSFDRSTVTVGPRQTTDVRVRLSVPLSTAGGGSLPGFQPFSDVSGLVAFTPVSGSNNGVTLRVPYYMVPQGVSHVSTKVDLKSLLLTGSSTATSTNRSAVDGSVDWYAWGISSKQSKALAGSSADVRAAGVSASAADDYLAFAISTYNRWSNASQNEIDVFVDVNNDGTPDYEVVGGDLGALSTGSFDGRNVSAVFDLNEGGGVLDNVSFAPTDSTTSVLPIELSLLSDSNPATSLNGTVNKRFTYWVVMNDLTTGVADTTGKAVFNPFTSAVSNGSFAAVPANGSATTPVSVNLSEFPLSPALGWMVVSQENPSGADEAQLIGARG